MGIVFAPQHFLLSYQAAEVAGRTLIAGGAGDPQQPLGRTRRGDPSRDQFGDGIEIARPRSPRWWAPPASARSTPRLTVLWVVPHNSAAPRYVPTWRYAEMMFIRSLADFNRAPWAVQHWGIT